MTREEKIDFVEQYFHSATLSIRSRVDRMPEEWDGHELRQYIADFFTASLMPLKGKRKRDYVNTVLTRGGL